MPFASARACAARNLVPFPSFRGEAEESLPSLPLSPACRGGIPPRHSVRDRAGVRSAETLSRTVQQSSASFVCSARVLRFVRPAAGRALPPTAPAIISLAVRLLSRGAQAPRSTHKAP
jgi:hypothetical protein